MEALGAARFLHKRDEPAFEDARADARQDVFLGFPLQDHGLDAAPVEQLPEQEPRRPAPDDRDLRSHRVPSFDQDRPVRA